MLHKLQRQFLIEAAKYNALPLDDRQVERLIPETGRPADADPGQLAACSSPAWDACRRTASSASRTSRSPSPPRSKLAANPANGVIIAQGGRFGGWSVYAKDGKLKFTYNVLGIHEFPTEATEPIPQGKHQVRMEFAYDGGGLAKGGNVTLYYDGKEVGKGRVAATQPMIFSADETTDIGYEVRHAGHPRLHHARTASSPARSTGCSSTWARTITTTSSIRRSACAWRWRGSKEAP